MTTATLSTFKVQDRPPVPTPEEIEQFRREARETVERQLAAKRLASWNLEGFAPEDVEALRLSRLT